MSNESTPSRKAFLLRLDPCLHAQVEAWAQQEMRSINGQIEWILREAVRRRVREEEGRGSREGGGEGGGA